MDYEKYRYIYPPRPKNAIDPKDLIFWDNKTLISQPKLNGSNTTIYTNGREIKVMNRHNSPLTNFKISREEIMSIFRGNEGEWLVINCEYLNKSKKDETNNLFNHKLVIFDILVSKSDYLIGSTFSSRVDLLDDLYGREESGKEYLYSVSENIFRVKTYENNFKEIYDNLTNIDLCEGLVLKRKGAKLEAGSSENNNYKSQLKVRKPTKNYKY